MGMLSADERQKSKICTCQITAPSMEIACPVSALHSGPHIKIVKQFKHAHTPRASTVCVLRHTSRRCIQRTGSGTFWAAWSCSLRLATSFLSPASSFVAVSISFLSPALSFLAVSTCPLRFAISACQMWALCGKGSRWRGLMHRSPSQRDLASRRQRALRRLWLRILFHIQTELRTLNQPPCIPIRAMNCGVGQPPSVRLSAVP